MRAVRKIMSMSGPGGPRSGKRSIADAAIDDFLERGAVEEAAEIVDEQAGDEAVALRMRSADMRQHDDALGRPERMLGRQRLLAEHVEQSARDLLALHRGDQVV